MEDLEVMGHLCINSAWIATKETNIDNHDDVYLKDADVHDHDVVVMMEMVITTTIMIVVVLLLMATMMHSGKLPRSISSIHSEHSFRTNLFTILFVTFSYLVGLFGSASVAVAVFCKNHR